MELEDTNKVCGDFEPDKEHEPPGLEPKFEPSDPIKWVEYHIAKRILKDNKKVFVNLRNKNDVDTYVYDGMKYVKDETFSILTLVIEGVNNLLELTLKDVQLKDYANEESEAKAYTNYYRTEKQFLSNRTLNSLVSLVSKLSVKPDVEFDSDKRYLNSISGVYDLKAHKLIQHSPMFYLTKIIPTEIYENAECPETDALLDYMFDGDQELIEYYLEIHASSLGRTRNDEYIFIIQGVVADNGKTSAAMALTKPFGLKESGYAVWMDTKAFTKKRTANATQPELIQAIGKCIAILDEPDREEMDVAILKNTSNFSEMSLRGLYESTKGRGWTATVVYLCNRLPMMDLKDAGAMRRVIVVPVEKQITKEMKEAPRRYNYGKELKYGDYLAVNEGPGIIKKQMEAYKRYQDRGYKLPPMPEKVRRATDAYIKKYNPVKKFVDEKTLCTTLPFPDSDKIDKNLKDKKPFYNAKSFHKDFFDYCEEELNMEHQMSVANVQESMEALGFKYTVISDNRTLRESQRVYEGVRPLFLFEKDELNKPHKPTVGYDARTTEGIEEISINKKTYVELVVDAIREMGAKMEPLMLGNKTVLKNPVNGDALKSHMKKMGVDEKEFNKAIKKMLSVGEIIYGYDGDKVLFYSLT
jgi:phage/plasmid-associated DNA primase